MLSTIHCSMMLNTLSPAAVNKGDEGRRKVVGSCGENTPGSSIASLTEFGEEERQRWRRYKPGGEGKRREEGERELSMMTMRWVGED